MLSVLAMQGESAEKRQYPENVHAQRNEFQRDRDRVVHSKYFRRLEYKTQVFVNHLGDNFRTRLTHSIEVAQIARTVARALQLNEDLTETIALAHDLGHPPFGHAGERALHEKMKNFGGFDHNDQTLRIVTRLEERYPNYLGLNLTHATVTGLQKHSSHIAHSLEAKIVDYCDEIAYNNHDIDDGLESGLLDLAALREISLWADIFDRTQKNFPSIKNKILVKTTIRELINYMVTDLISSTQSRIQESGLKSLSALAVYSTQMGNPPLVAFSDAVDAEVKQLKKFLFRKLYRHAEVVKMNERARSMIHRIFDFVQFDPKMLPEDYYERIETDGTERVIADFVAGMTDRYAIKWNNDILGV